MRFFLLAAGCAALGAAACGSNVSVGAGGGGAAAGPCPVTAPSGGSCSEQGRHCTYGASPRPECRDLWICSGSAWMKTNGKSACIEPAPGTCDQLPPNPDGVACQNDGDVCVAGTATICICNSCAPGGPCSVPVPPPQWTCAGPPATPGCPAIAPNEGTACPTADLSCTYGKPCVGSGTILGCVDGAWVGPTYGGGGLQCPD